MIGLPVDGTVSTPPESDRSFRPIPSRRTYGAQRRGRRLEDVRDRLIVLRALLWSPAGLVLGLAVGYFGTERLGFPGWTLLLCGLVGWAFVFGLPLLITHFAGRAAGTLYAPSGRTTPHRTEHSRALALMARGLHEDAVGELTRAVEADPTDAVACVQAARVLRDDLGRYEEAAAWMRRALRAGSLPIGQARAVRRELIELFVHRLGTPERAAPELARLAEELAGTPGGEWAAAELRAIKVGMGDGGADG